MINKWAICCNKQVAFLVFKNQGAKFATWSWCGSLRPAPFLLYPFVGWTSRVQLIFIFKWSKRPLDSGGGRSDHHHFYLSEQCFGTISKKYRHYSETFRHCSESEYSLCFRRLFQLPTSKNNQNSLKIRSIHWIFAFQVLILRTWSVKWCGLGRGDPPQNQWVKMDHWFLSEQYRKKSLVLFRI